MGLLVLVLALVGCGGEQQEKVEPLDVWRYNGQPVLGCGDSILSTQHGLLYQLQQAAVTNGKGGIVMIGPKNPDGDVIDGNGVHWQVRHEAVGGSTIQDVIARLTVGTEALPTPELTTYSNAKIFVDLVSINNTQSINLNAADVVVEAGYYMAPLFDLWDAQLAAVPDGRIYQYNCIPRKNDPVRNLKINAANIAIANMVEEYDDERLILLDVHAAFMAYGDITAREADLYFVFELTDAGERLFMQLLYSQFFPPTRRQVLGSTFETHTGTAWRRDDLSE